MLKRIKAAAQAAAGKAADTLSAGFETLQGPLVELAAAGPALERIGYALGTIEVHCALVPRLTAELRRLRAPTEEEFQAASANAAASRTLRTVTGMLRQAERILGSVHIAGRRCTGVVLELGLPPSFRLVFTADPVAAVASAPSAAQVPEGTTRAE